MDCILVATIRRLVVFVLPAFMVCPAARGEAGATSAVDLAFAPAPGVSSGGGRLALRYTAEQVDDGAVWFEAEQAAAVQFEQGRGGFMADASSSGGLHLTFVQFLEFDFELSRAGEYTAWYRGFFPRSAHWGHSERMDDQPPRNVEDFTPDRNLETGVWIWTKGPTWTLAEGPHRWSLSPAWMGGAGLDKLVLLPAGSSAPGGQGGSPRGRYAEAEAAVSDPVARDDVAAWKRLAFDRVTDGGGVDIHYSTDRGASWQPLPATGDLSDTSPDATLLFRVQLNPDAQGRGPRVANLQVLFEPVPSAIADGPPLVLTNSKAELTFARRNGALIGIRNKAAQTDCMAGGVQSPLFAFRVMRYDVGVPTELTFDSARLTSIEQDSPERLQLHYALRGGEIKVVLTIRLESTGLARFSIEVDNRSEYRIVETVLLSLRGLRIGNDPTDDYLCSPGTSGSIYQYPAALNPPRARWQRRGDVYYPGLHTMCWMSLFDPDAGSSLYLAVEDKEFYRTKLVQQAFQSGTSGDATFRYADLYPVGETVDLGRGRELIVRDKPGDSMMLGFEKQQLIDRTTGPVRLADAVIGIFEGDWHGGADAYREWIEPWARPEKKTPAWWTDAQGVADHHMSHLGDFVHLTAGLSKQRATDGSLIPMNESPFSMHVIWAQMVGREGAWSIGSLDRLQGTEEQFAWAIRRQHELGNRMAFYLHPGIHYPGYESDGLRFFSSPRPLIPDDEFPAAGFYDRVGIRRYDGRLASVHDEGKVCLGVQELRDYKESFVIGKYIEQYGADGMYLDAMGLVSQECNDLSHGHAYGQWNQYLNRWLKSIRDRAQALRPGAVFLGEGVNDVELRYLEAGIVYVDNAPEVTRYTLPWNDGLLWGSNVPADYPLHGAEYMALFGWKFCGAEYNFRPPEAPERIWEALDFRRRFFPLQSRGRFMDNVGLRVANTKTVKAKLFTRDDAGARCALVVAWNPENETGATVTVDAARVGALRSAWVLTPGERWQRVLAREQDGRYVVELPPARLSAVVLAERCEPLIEMERIQPVPPGEGGVARVHIANLESEPLVGTVRLALPEGWQSDVGEFRVLDNDTKWDPEFDPRRVKPAILPGERVTFELGFFVAPDVQPGVQDVRAVVRDRDRSTAVTRPMGVTRPLHANLFHVSQQRVDLEIESWSRRAISGTGRLVSPEGVAGDPASFDFAVDPRGRSVIPLNLSGVGDLKTREPLKVVLEYGRFVTEAHALAQPPLVNGGFEMETSGSGIPDFWNYQMHRPYYSGFALDTNVVASGIRSLRMDANPRRIGLGNSYVRLAPNRTYRLSCRIRCSALGNVRVTLSSRYDEARTLGPRSEDDVGQWKAYELTFRTPDQHQPSIPYIIHCMNDSQGMATAWFDDLVLEELDAAHEE